MIVDDHEVARRGIGQILASSDFEVAASVSTGDLVMQTLDECPCAIVLLDIRLDGRDGLSILEQIRERYAELPVVVLSSYDNPTYVARATAMGAHDYVLKNGSAKEICACLHAALGGHSPPEGSRLAQIQRIMRQDVRADELPPEFPLTSREAQVLRHIALGLSNKEIARSLRISVETVKEHVQSILRKTKSTDRTDAAVRAVRLGMVD